MAQIRSIKLIIIFLVLLYGALLNAKGGTAGSDFLTIYTDAKPASLSGAYVATASGISSIFTNPAGIALTDRTELSATHTIEIYDRYTEHFSAAVPLHDFNLGFSCTYNYTSDFIEIDEYGDKQGIVANYDYIFCANVSEQFSGWLSGGINLKYFGSYLYKHAKNGIAIDFGAIICYDIFRFGISVQNLGTQSAYITVIDPMPVLIRSGLGIKYRINASDCISAETGVIVPAETGEEKSFNLGAEYFTWNALSLRAGINIYELSGYSISLGAGLLFNGFNFEYALGSVNNSKKSHRLGITFIFQ
jgi:hypothetical protein